MSCTGGACHPPHPPGLAFLLFELTRRAAAEARGEPHDEDEDATQAVFKWRCERFVVELVRLLRWY